MTECCDLNLRHWQHEPSVVLPPGPSTNYSHPKCYLGVYKDCSDTISREHMVSRSVLVQIGNPFSVSGLLWQERGKVTQLSPDAFAANVLCTRHNNALSPLDAVGARFAEAIWLNERSGLAVRGERVLTFAGEDIERWMLKTFIGLIVSRNAGIPGIKMDDKPSREMLDLLLGLVRWLPGFGLWLVGTGVQPTRFGTSFAMRLLKNNAGVYGASFYVGGFHFVLSMNVMTLGAMQGRADAPYRPRAIRFARSDDVLEIRLSYKDAFTQTRVIATMPDDARPIDDRASEKNAGG